MKCAFSLENVQPSPFENEGPIVNFRYCPTKAYQTKLFDDYIYFNLREGILERVINNGMTSSSWHFNQLLYVNVKILDYVSQFFLVRRLILLILRKKASMVTSLANVT